MLDHGAGHEAHANQQIAGGIGVVREQLDIILSLGTRDPHQGEQQNRQQCRERDGHGLGDPEHHHQHGDRQHPLAHHSQSLGGRHEADDQHQQNAHDESDFANFEFTHRISSS